MTEKPSSKMRAANSRLSSSFQIEHKVRETIQKTGMISPKDTVIAGVSGGADSTAMLFVLKALQEEFDFTLRVVHVMHGLRETAHKDAEYVEKLCNELSVPCKIIEVPCKEYAQEQGLGLEEAARILRYEALRTERNHEAQTKIAVAHHREDQAETVLFHLCRGSSVRGLSGIAPVSGEIIRPFLYLKKEEILSYLAERSVTYQQDETNEDTSYARNYLRLKVLPELSANINEGSVSHIADVAEDLRECEAYLQEETTKAYEACVEDDAILLPRLFSYAPFIQKRVLYSLLTKWAGREKDLARVHVEDLYTLAHGTGNGSLSLPYGVTATKSYDRLYCASNVAFEKGQYPQEEGCYQVTRCDFDGDITRIPIKKYTKWFDYDKIYSQLCFRTREKGDVMTITEDGKHKSLARMMIDEKIPVAYRDGMVMPFVGKEVLWLPGHRISALMKVSAETRNVLELSLSCKNSTEE